MVMMASAALDCAVLAALETGIPIDARPFGVIARRLGMLEDSLLERVRHFLGAGEIRRLAVVFDSRALGFATTLAAAKAREGRDADAVALVNSLPEVTHHYRRSGSGFDLWFTLVASSRARIGGILGDLARSAVFESLMELPATRVFKLDVRFAPMGADAEGPGAGNRREAAGAAKPVLGGAADLSDTDRRVVSALCDGIEPVARPYLAPARAAALPEGELVAALRSLEARGVVRKVAAILRAEAFGMLAGALVAWRVAGDEAARVGEALAALPEVTHCYERKTPSDWPYNVYTMIHGRDDEAVLRTARAAARSVGVTDYAVLATREELKKSPARYCFERDGAQKA